MRFIFNLWSYKTNIIMKKLIVILSLICCCNFLGAQVRLETCSFKELLEKAKKENKLALVVGSTTWCGPCRHLYNKLFPLKDIGEFMNSKFVVRKYELDKECPPEIKSLNITGYPTFVFLDASGNEISRFCGIEFEPEKFKLQIEEALKKENTWNARLLRFQQDPSYAKEHIIYLMRLRRMNEADLAVFDSFSKRTSEEKFSDDYLAIYKRLVLSNGKRTLQLLLDNQVEAEKIMSHEKYVLYMNDLGRDLIFNNGNFLSKEKLDSVLTLVENNPVLKTQMFIFAKQAKNAITDNKIEDIVRIALEMIDQFTPHERYCIACYVGDHAKSNQEKEKYVDYLKRAIEVETDERMLTSLKSRLTMIGEERK